MVESRWAMTMEVRPARAVSSARWMGLGFGIEMGGGLVENDNVRRLEEQTGDSKALLLAAGEAVAALADHGFELVGETLYEIQNLRVAKSGADLVVGGIGRASSRPRGGRGRDGHPE